jgi:hypothetical protein
MAHCSGNSQPVSGDANFSHTVYHTEKTAYIWNEILQEDRKFFDLCQKRGIYFSILGVTDKERWPAPRYLALLVTFDGSWRLSQSSWRLISRSIRKPNQRTDSFHINLAESKIVLNIYNLLFNNLFPHHYVVAAAPCNLLNNGHTFSDKYRQGFSVDLTIGEHEHQYRVVPAVEDAWDEPKRDETEETVLTSRPIKVPKGALSRHSAGQSITLS